MNSRRTFLKESSYLAAGAILFPSLGHAAFGHEGKKMVGLQLYTVRKEMSEDATGTLKKIAKIGYKELESARSEKGNYYGLKPKEIKHICADLGMVLRSGHIHVDDHWQQSIEEAAETGQQYLISAVLPSSGQTVENYQKSADAFSQYAADCKKVNIKFGYHNHATEFEKVNGQVLYDILLDRVDSSLVIMEMDLGWVVAAGADPFAYFDKYPGRFPLWHLKDVDKAKNISTEFGKGQVDIMKLFAAANKSGMKHYFVEQEDYANSALESAAFDFQYLKSHQ